MKLRKGATYAPLNVTGEVVQVIWYALPYDGFTYVLKQLKPEDAPKILKSPGVPYYFWLTDKHIMLSRPTLSSGVLRVTYCQYFEE